MAAKLSIVIELDDLEDATVLFDHRSTDGPLGFAENGPFSGHCPRCFQS